MSPFFDVVYVVLAWASFLGGIFLDVQVWRGKIASGEPQMVLHLSTWALIYTGLTNIKVA